MWCCTILIDKLAIGDAESRGLKEDARGCVGMAIAHAREAVPVRIGIIPGTALGNFGSQDQGLHHHRQRSELGHAVAVHAENDGIVLATRPIRTKSQFLPRRGGVIREEEGFKFHLNLQNDEAETQKRQGRGHPHP